MENKKTGLFFALAVVFVLSLSFMVSAYRGNFDVKGPEYDEARCDEMNQIFDGNDFAAWRDLKLSEGKARGVLRVVDEDNFHLFVEAHEAGLAGDVDRANALRAELGLNDGLGPKNGAGHGKLAGFGEMAMKGQGRGVNGAHQFKNK